MKRVSLTAGKMRVTFHGEIPREVMQETWRFVLAVPSLFRIRHYIDIAVGPGHKIVTPDGRYAWGCYDADYRTIFVGGWAMRAMKKEGFSKTQAAFEYLGTIAHELVHYEQHRDRRQFTERGVQQRADAIVRRYMLKKMRRTIVPGDKRF